MKMIYFIEIVENNSKKTNDNQGFGSENYFLRNVMIKII